MHVDEMNQRAHERAMRSAKAAALREAAADLFEFGDEQYVPAAKWLNERAEELEREPA